MYPEDVKYISQRELMSELYHHDPKAVSPKDRLDSATWRNDHVVAEKFVWPHEQRVSLRHDEFIMDSSENIHRDDQIPVIDLACLGLNLDNDDVQASRSKDELEDSAARRKRASLVSRVRDACLRWGFFHVINHGVPQGIVTGMRKQALQLFGLPLEEKLRVAKVPESFTGYGHATVKEEDAQPWSEGFYLSDFANATQVSRTLWAEANKEFAAAYKEYEEQMRRVAGQLMEIIIESLNVTNVAHDFEKYLRQASGLFRWNYYPPCPEPHKTLGMNVHTDFTLLTLLHLDDEVGGLQVQRGDGSWIAVRPQPESFAVNIGDMIQVLTNGKYKSVPHRAVVNRTSARLSLTYLFLPTKGIDIVASPKLLADTNMSTLYRPFTFEYYTELKQRQFLNTLDHFRQ